jgi:hypothetical protein
MKTINTNHSFEKITYFQGWGFMKIIYFQGRSFMKITYFQIEKFCKEKLQAIRVSKIHAKKLNRFSFRNFSNSHKSNCSSCPGVQVKFKNKLGVKHNDLCLWSSWCCFMHPIVHQTQLGLPLVISIATSWISSTHVVSFVHDLGISKSPCISRYKKKQIVFFFFFSSSYQTFNNKIKSHNTKNIDSGPDNGTKRCRSQTSLGLKLCMFIT